MTERKLPRDMDAEELSSYLVNLFVVFGITPRNAIDAMHILLNKALEKGKEDAIETKE